MPPPAGRRSGLGQWGGGGRAREGAGGPGELPARPCAEVWAGRNAGGGPIREPAPSCPQETRSRGKDPSCEDGGDFSLVPGPPPAGASCAHRWQGGLQFSTDPPGPFTHNAWPWGHLRRRSGTSAVQVGCAHRGRGCRLPGSKSRVSWGPP